MPFLNDEEFASLHDVINTTEKKLSKSEAELKETTEELVAAQTRLEEHDEDLKSVKKTKTVQNVILSILFGTALALAYYFYTNGSNNINNIDVNEIKQLEATRVLDSINALNTNDSYSDSENNDSNTITAPETSIDDSIQSINDNVNSGKIYSVQIGAFAKDNYILSSGTLAGISSSERDMYKYSIGLFKTLKEAQDFRKELVKIGFSDAFVASYVNGIRQEIENPY